MNTGAVADLVTFFVYPGHAGHDYGSIEKQGFRKLVVERDGTPTLRGQSPLAAAAAKIAVRRIAR